MDHLIQRLPGLFAQDWPMVPNHPHLLENNIYVDPDTGRLVGIFDWRYVEVSPFGMSLGGLESMLGVGRMAGWCFHTNHQALRAEFWAAFNEAAGNVDAQRIEIARLVGIFRRNGWERSDDNALVPAREGTHLVAYLDAVVLRARETASG